MAAAIPRPSRPSYGPPTTSLPALPTTKTRKSTGAIPTIADSKIGLQTTLPKSGQRAPAAAATQTSPITPLSTTSLPKLRSTPGVNAAGKTIRKTISINAFPQPPRSGVRTTSLPPSPLSAGVIPAGPSTKNVDPKNSADASPISPGNQKLRRTKQSISPGNANYGGNSTPSLLNGSGDSKSISGGPGARGSDGLLSLPSPPQSRSSSAQDSYSTSATNYDDATEGPRGRQSSEAINDQRSPKAVEGKGNVIVSVRVRPDANGNGERNKTDGEWMVDGRRALVAYRGREGGDYYYGNDPSAF